MADERYDLQQRIQELVAMAGVSFRNFKAMHHVSFATFYQFVKDPGLARPRTLTSVRLMCEFLEAALTARLLPLQERTDIEAQLDKMYMLWWNNGKKFPVLEEPKADEIETLFEQ
jgi:hypothetical protein